MINKKCKQIFLILLCLSSFSNKTSFSQAYNVPDIARNFYYIDYETCKLEHFDDNKNLSIFYDKLDKLSLFGKEQVSILHLGGSHIQAGTWSWEVREILEKTFSSKNGAPGFVFPYKIAKTNHPIYYRSELVGNWDYNKIVGKNKITQEIGISGITGYTYDSIAEIKIIFNPIAKIEDHKFNKISIFHNAEDTAYCINIMPEHIIDSCIIDRLSGVSTFYLNQSIVSLDCKINKNGYSNNPFCFYGAYLENSYPGITYSAIGINGASTSSFNKTTISEQHLNIIKPDIAILSFAVNDAASKEFSRSRFYSDYSNIIMSILRANPNCAIILSSNNDFYNYRGGNNKNYDKLYSELKNLARDFNCSVWDMHKIMGGYYSINTWKDDNFAKKDRIHFTKEGYKLFANLIFEAILKDYKIYINNKNFINTHN